MPNFIALTELHTLIVGLVALGVGATVTYKIPFVKRLGLPISVTGGVLVALLVAVIRNRTGYEIQFATHTRDAGPWRSPSEHGVLAV